MKNEWRSPAAGAILIILLTLVVYLPAIRGSFVVDDYMLIIDNPMVRPIEGIHGFSVATTGDNYYPLTWSVWWLEWRLWGKNPMGYHVANILLHAANAVLVWLILRELKIPGAWGGGWCLPCTQ